jgi:hypothetical protein
MQRDHYKPVTRVPVLIPAAVGKHADGKASWVEGYRSLQPVTLLKTDASIFGLLKDAEREELLAIVSLIQTLRQNDPLATRSALERVNNLNDPRFGELLTTMMTQHHSFAQRELSRIISKELEQVRLKLWWNGHRFSPALFCPSTKTGIYVETLLSTIGGKAVTVCPRCGNMFVQERSNKDYCSIRCREAHRVARWRARKTTGIRGSRSGRSSLSRRKKR